MSDASHTNGVYCVARVARRVDRACRRWGTDGGAPGRG